MFDEILAANEGKILEFKETPQPPLNIIKTIVAFANTSGGKIVIGVKDKTKEIIGVKNILQEEERLASIIADSVEPLLIPDIEVVNYKKHELLIINVPCLVGPFYIKKAGLQKGVYIRLGSTNRLADDENIAYLQRLAKQISFDEMPCIGATLADLNENFISTTLSKSYQSLQKKNYHSLNLIALHHNKQYPTYGALLMFGKNRIKWFPDSTIRCVCFLGTARDQIIDQKDIDSNLIESVNDVIAFIERHTSVAAKIGAIKREDIPQFPPQAVREVVINAIVHADYAMKGASIQIAVFSDRIEFTNPGSLPFGQTIESALSGISRLRNRLIGRIFREIKLIERLGSGIPRVLASYTDKVAKMPQLDEINNHFRVTLFGITTPSEAVEQWEHLLLNALSTKDELGTKEIADLWSITDRAARMRLKMMVTRGLVKRNATSKNDPNAKYSRS